MQSHDYPTLAGQVMTTYDLRRLAQALVGAGATVRIGESCHYKSGHYVAVAENGANVIFEKIEKNECLVSGEADTVEALISIVTAVSYALSNLDLKHRFEIYWPSHHLIAYRHHGWPQR